MSDKNTEITLSNGDYVEIGETSVERTIKVGDYLTLIDRRNITATTRKVSEVGLDGSYKLHGLEYWFDRNGNDMGGINGRLYVDLKYRNDIINNGDWIEFTNVDSLAQGKVVRSSKDGKLYVDDGNLKCLCINVEDVVRKITPFEVVVKIGMIVGTVIRNTSYTSWYVANIMGLDGNMIATVFLSLINDPRAQDIIDLIKEQDCYGI